LLNNFGQYTDKAKGIALGMVVGGGIWYEAARDFSKTTST